MRSTPSVSTVVPLSGFCRFSWVTETRRPWTCVVKCPQRWKAALGHPQSIDDGGRLVPRRRRNDPSFPGIVGRVWVGARNTRGSLSLKLLTVADGPNPLECNVVNFRVSNRSKSVESDLDRLPEQHLHRVVPGEAAWNGSPEGVQTETVQAAEVTACHRRYGSLRPWQEANAWGHDADDRLVWSKWLCCRRQKH